MARQTKIERQPLAAAFLLISLSQIASGAAALIYQSVWARMFSVVFGTSEAAIAAVLVSFMGGLAIGAALVGKFISKIGRPLLFYAILEAAIAIYAVLFPFLLHFAGLLHVDFAGGNPELQNSAGFGDLAAKFSLAFFVLLLPTICMGATLPLLIRRFVSGNEKIASGVGWLYSLNTLGAVIGCLAAGWWLIPALGLKSTTHVGVGANLLAAILAIAAWKWARSPGPENAQTEPLDETISHTRRSRIVLLGVVLGLTGFLSFMLEILWTRCLGQILGGSVKSFSTMLGTFLLGIVFGSLLARKLGATTRNLALRRLGYCLCAFAFFTLLAHQLLGSLPAWLDALEKNRTDQSIWGAVLSFSILIPATIALGATFPLGVRAISSARKSVAPHSAMLYACNTIGAVLGALIGGLIFIPALGFAGAAAFIGCGAFALGVVALAWGRHWKNLLPPVIVGVLVIGIFFPNNSKSFLLSSPFLGQHATNIDSELLWHRVGHSSSVTVADRAGEIRLRNNGLPEALIKMPGSFSSSANPMRWMATLPFLKSTPKTPTSLVIGFGGGELVNAIPPHVSQIDVVELEPEVVAANQFLSDQRQRDPLIDPRVRLVENDIRGALKMTTQRWDAIISQPSHPWTAGSSHLYTAEFFAEIKSHLTEKTGVFIQWIGGEYLDRSLLASLCAAMQPSFENVSLFQIGTTFVFYATDSPDDWIAALENEEIETPGITRRRSGWNGIQFPAGVRIAQLMAPETVREFAADAVPVTDDKNQLAFRSLRLSNEKKSLRTLSKIDAELSEFDWVGNEYRGSPADAILIAHKLSQSLTQSTRLENFLKDQPATTKAVWAAIKALEKGDQLTAKAEFAKITNREAFPFIEFYVGYFYVREIPFRTDRPSLFDLPSDFKVHDPDMNRHLFAAADRLTEGEKLALEVIFAHSNQRWQKIVELAPAALEKLDSKTPYAGFVKTAIGAAFLKADPNSKSDGTEAVKIMTEVLESGYGFLNTSALRYEAGLQAGEPEIVKFQVRSLISVYHGLEKTEANHATRAAIQNTLSQMATILQSEPEYQSFLDDLTQTGDIQFSETNVEF